MFLGYPAAVRLGQLLHHCSSLEEVTLSKYDLEFISEEDINQLRRCKLAGQCLAKSDSLLELQLLECVIADVTLKCPRLVDISMNDCVFKAKFPKMMDCGTFFFFFGCRVVLD
jgi:hypothetical protein